MQTQAREHALEGYVLRYPITLRPAADFLALDHKIWPICLYGCGWHPPVDLASVILVKGQDYPVSVLMKQLAVPGMRRPH